MKLRLGQTDKRKTENKKKKKTWPENSSGNLFLTLTFFFSSNSTSYDSRNFYGKVRKNARRNEKDLGIREILKFKAVISAATSTRTAKKAIGLY